MYRLTSILNKKTLAPEKLEELQKKLNILAAFVAKKGEEYSEEAKVKVEEAKQKVLKAGAEL
jgi:protein disulfide-isomerase A6